jgi:type I restriction enzyme, S subunit
VIFDLKPYPAYKDSGVDRLGQVPEGWGVQPVGAIARVINGHPFDSRDFDSDLGHPLIRIRDLDKDVTATRYVGPFLDRVRVEPGDLIVGMDGEFNVGTWKGKEPALLNQRLCCIHGRSSRLTHWLRHALPGPLRELNDLASGTTVKHLSSGEVERIVVPLPEDEEEFTGIIHLLDYVSSRIQQVVETKERLIELLEQEKKAIVRRAVTGELLRAVSCKPSGLDWLGDVPENWDILPLRLRYSVRLGKMLDTKRFTGTSLLPYLRNTDVQWDQINTEGLPEMDISPDERHRYTVKLGDLLVCEGGEVGRAAIWEQSGVVGYQKALHRLRPYDGERDRPRFLYFLLRALADLGLFKADGSQNTIAHLTAEKLRRLRLPFPPTQEQEAIAAQLKKELEPREIVAASARSQVGLLREYRTRLISDIVTGKRDVREAAAELPDDSDADDPALDDRLEEVAAG